MLGLRFSRLVHAAIASGALVFAACPGGGKGDSDTDTGTSTGDPTDPTTGLPGNTLDPTLGPAPLPPVPPDPPPPVPPDPPVDTTPPALVSATFLDPLTLQLSFTEPIAPVDTVNPKRFRLSFAQGYAGNYGGEPSTFLSDPRFYNNTAYCPPAPPCYYEPPYYCYDPYCYYQPSDPIHATALVNHDSDPNSVLIPLSTAIQPSLCQLLESIGDDPNFQVVLHLHYADGGLSQVTDLAGVPLPALAEEWVKSGADYLAYDGVVFPNFAPFVPIPCPFF